MQLEYLSIALSKYAHLYDMIILTLIRRSKYIQVSYSCRYVHAYTTNCTSILQELQTKRLANKYSCTCTYIIRKMVKIKTSVS